MATQLAERATDPVSAFRQTLSQPAFREQLKMALPSHISPEKFERVATTAVQTNPDLLDGNKVERRSLFGALVRAAQDGLLPDGREGAIVPFKGKAAWMPMVAGIMRKVRNSGEIASWDASPVFEKDTFERLLGDDQRIYHKPYEDGDPGEVRGAYSIVTFKDGTKSRDYLPRWRIDKALAQNPRGASSLMRTTFFDEAAVKTVIRHHAKRLPQSTDVEALFERDDVMRGEVAPSPPEPPMLEAAPATRLDALESRLGLADGPDETVAPEVDVEDELHPAQAVADQIIAAAEKAISVADVNNLRGLRASDIAAMPDPLAEQVRGALDAAEQRLRGGDRQ